MNSTTSINPVEMDQYTTSEINRNDNLSSVLLFAVWGKTAIISGMTSVGLKNFQVLNLEIISLSFFISKFYWSIFQSLNYNGFLGTLSKLSQVHEWYS